MSDKYKWLFPSGCVGIIGINNGNIETFKDHPISSLGREICQNSGDAVNDDSKPVFVEFKLFKIKISDFPDIAGMRRAVSSCKEFWKYQNNPKATTFFKAADETVNSDEMTILRISDHNTAGLDGADRPDDASAHWTSLVMSSGTSSKDGSNVGGSFGIGKFAAFANSKIRTVFYSTVDKNGRAASEGVSYLATFKDENGEKTYGQGFCGCKQGPVFEQLDLDPNYHRTSGDPGTDIYICGFANSPGWSNQLAASILDSFFYAIDKKYLVVNVDGIRIDNKSLDDTIEKCKNYCSDETRDYLEVMREEGEFIDFDDFDGNKNSLHVKLLVKNGLHRKIAMVRKTGMKIFDKGRLHSNISFAGILYVSNENANRYLTSLENPQHKAWLYERDEKDPEHAKKYISYISAKLRAELQKIIDQKYSGAVEPQTGSFLQSISSDKGNQTEQDVLVDRPVELKPKRHNTTPKVTFEVLDGNGAGGDGEGYEGGKDYGSENGGGESGYGNGNGGEGTRGENSGTETNGNAEGSFQKVKSRSIPLKSRRLIGINVSGGEYIYKLNPAVSSNNAEIDISISAEDGTYTPDFEQITIDDQPKVKVNRGKIMGVKMVESQPIVIRQYVKALH